MSDETKITENGNVSELLSQIKDEMKRDNRKDAAKDTVRNLALVIMAVCVVIVSGFVIYSVNSINQKINAIYTKADAAVTTLYDVAGDIQDADLAGMAEQIKALTEDATDAVAATMDKIDALDIDSLNSTIHQLDETTEAFSSTVDAINSIFGH